MGIEQWGTKLTKYGCCRSIERPDLVREIVRYCSLMDGWAGELLQVCHVCSIGKEEQRLIPEHTVGTNFCLTSLVGLHIPEGSDRRPRARIEH